MNSVTTFLKVHAKVFAAFMIAACFTLVIPFAALAADGELPVPSTDIAQVLLNLATNYNTLGVIGVLSLACLLSVQLVKQFVKDDWKWKRFSVVVFSIAYSIASGFLVPGSNVPSVIITVFLSSGGAMALYEALKGAGVIAKA